MPDVAILAKQVQATPNGYTIPGSQRIILKAVRASFDGTSAAGPFVPTLQVVAPGNPPVVVFDCPLGTALAAGALADVSWFRGVAKTQVQFSPLAFNLGSLGSGGSGTLLGAYDMTVQNQDVLVGDGILVSVLAPSVPSMGAGPFIPITCADSQGNSYSALGHHKWQANPPNVNEGAWQTWFYCPSATFELVAGTDTISGIWDGNVYDRFVAAWNVRHSGGPGTPTLLAANADSDAAVFASNQVTLQSPGYTVGRDQGFNFATVFAAKNGGLGGFGAVAGFNGYYQADFISFNGSKQGYFLNPQTYGADAYIIANAGINPYEIDLGTLDAGTVVPTFNGVGQFFTTGANAWKGITLWSID